MDTTITLDNLKQEKPVQIPTLPQDNTNYAGMVSGVTDSLANEYNTLNQQLTQAQKAQQSEANNIASIMEQLAGRTQDTQLAQEQTGVTKEKETLTKLAEQLANLNAQASSLNREAQAIPIQVQQESAGLGRTDTGVAPITTGRLRENALKALSIAQQSDIASAALTGSELRLTQAKEKAQQIVDLKYKPLEESLAAKKLQYDLNKDYLTSLDKKRTEALQVALNREEKQLAEKKANEKAISDMIVNAASQNAPSDLLNLAKNAKTATQAAMILRQYAGDYYKTELLKQQIETEKAQRAKINASIKEAGIPQSLQNVKTSGDLQNATMNLKLTEGQSKALAFGQRAINADKAIKERLQTYDPTTIFSSGGRLLQTDNARAFERDLTDFITAVLRKESGATITEDEFDRFIPLYSPQGVMTNQQDIEQTNLKRSAAIDALISESGTAAPALSSYKINNSVSASTPTDNSFSKALGVAASNISPAASISFDIVKNISENGNIEFSIPTTK